MSPIEERHRKSVTEVKRCVSNMGVAGVPHMGERIDTISEKVVAENFPEPISPNLSYRLMMSMRPSTSAEQQGTLKPA
jgi:hypothetical protein